MPAISANSCAASYKPSPVRLGGACLIRKKLLSFNTLLFIETILVIAAAVWIIKLLFNSGAADVVRLIIPAVLMTAAVVPTLIRGRKLRHIGLNVKNARLSIRLLFWASLLILPSVLLVIWLFRLCGINSPLQQAAIPQNGWLYWIVFQFFYVAMAEELFFRGFLQTNILAITKKLMRRGLFQRFVVVFASAICFAAAHMIIRFQIAGILTFFPGLVLGWLFLRTRSLVAPVLFHGLANTCFILICMFLT